jgi:cytochrome c oxidase cbb3-type subunit I/II
MRSLGVPYPAGFESNSIAELNKQANVIASGLRNSGIQVEDQKQIIALIAYLQRLGTDVGANPEMVSK